MEQKLYPNLGKIKLFEFPFFFFFSEIKEEVVDNLCK